jgi:hypothetical protein
MQTAASQRPAVMPPVTLVPQSISSSPAAPRAGAMRSASALATIRATMRDAASLTLSRCAAPASLAVSLSMAVALSSTSLIADFTSDCAFATTVQSGAPDGTKVSGGWRSAVQSGQSIAGTAAIAWRA